MCGIVGAFNLDGGRVTDDDTLLRMRDRMVHRGPDGGGLWRADDGACVFGHRRLSIIDLSTAANQPMLSADGKVAIVFNGEIYNHAELRAELQASGRHRFRTDHSDTEALLEAYLEWGPECVQRLYGMFAFVIHDARDAANPQVHLVRDRVGIKPLYFTRTAAGEWLFASEIKALLVNPAVDKTLNDHALWHYLSFIVSPAPMTMFDGIFKLPAATWATIEKHGRTRARRYWDCAPRSDDFLTTSDLSLDDAANEVTRLLRQSIKRRMVSDVPFGVLLSGGVDSSLNVALMSELMDRPVSTFTIGYREYDEFNEFQHARRVAESFSTEHHEALIDGNEALDLLPALVDLQDEPIADNVCIPLYFLAKLVRDSGTTVVQVGEGADENFLGYWWCDHYRDKEQSIYGPALRGLRPGNRFKPWLRKLLRRTDPIVTATTPEDEEIIARARTGEELFWGGAVCWWGSLRNQLTPDRTPFTPPRACPIDGLLPSAHLELDSHAVVADFYRQHGLARETLPVTRKIPFVEHQLRLPEHLLMRVDKMTMAHSIEARVPFLDHDVVDFARRLPVEYKLNDGVGKRVLKKIAEPYIDHELIYRRKQGFGAPMDKWFREDEFARSCRDAFAKSELCKRGFFDNAFVEELLKAQYEGRTSHGFHLWTIMNAVFWHKHWFE